MNGKTEVTDQAVEFTVLDANKVPFTFKIEFDCGLGAQLTKAGWQQPIRCSKPDCPKDAISFGISRIHGYCEEHTEVAREMLDRSISERVYRTREKE